MASKPTAELIGRANDSYQDMMMVASPSGRCYLFDRNTGRISCIVETGEKFIHLADRGDHVDDYLGLKSQNPNAIDWSDNNTNLYHFKPNNMPKLITLVTKEKIQQYVNHHYKDSNTMVNKTKQVYHFNHAGQNTNDTSPGAAFKIEREDFYIRRSSPDWSLRFARIRAWFPSFSDQQRHQPHCVVYHARDSSKFIQVCQKYNLHPLPIDNTLNKLMVSLKNNQKISVPENDQIVAKGKHKTVILEGSYDGVSAIVKRVRTGDDNEATKLQQKLRSTCYHENVAAYLGWETHGDFNYYAFEKCGVTLAEYVKSSPYVEMSDEAMKIMCGLVDGVKHLHTKGMAHMNLNPHNILVDGGTVKICGMSNSKPLSEVRNGVACDIHNLGHIILYLISNGQHDVPDVEDVATFTYRYPGKLYMDNLKSTLVNGTNEEAWYLLDHLGFFGQTNLSLTRPIVSTAQLKMQPYFWSIPERLGFLKDLSDHLHEGNPDPQLVNELELLLTEVLGSPQGSWFNLVGGAVVNGVVVKDSVLDAMRYVVPKPGARGKYNEHSIVSLIRFTRNAQNHLQNFDSNQNQNQRAALLRELGKNEKELEQNLRKKIPLLLTRSHRVVAGHYTNIDFLKKYYP